MTDFSRVKFDEQGLVPAVVQDWRDGSVLMLAFMNREALQKTLETKSVHFWSRSRKKLWEKGETSGNKLALKDLFVDCDGDTLLIKAEPAGPTCHTGERACFFSRLEGNGEKTQEAWGGIIERLYQTIQERKRQPSSDSYTSTLLQGGIDKVLKKVVEEAGEVVLAGKGGKKEEIVYETADLLFHTLVALGYHDIQPEEIYRELAKRFGKSGLRQAPAARAKEGTMGQNQQEQRRQTERREGEDRRGQSLNRQGAERRKIQSRRARADRRGRA